MQKIFLMTMLLLCYESGAYASTELITALDNVRHNCGNISAELSDMKTMAGINTAVTATGTVTGGVGLATGIAKSNIDKEIEELEKEIERLKNERGSVPVENLTIQDEIAYKQQLHSFINSYIPISQKEQELSEAEKKSKTLGNVRTGMLATSTATNVAGTIIAANNRVKGDLKSRIDACLTSVKELSNARMQARISETASDSELAYAERVVHACDAWNTVDVSSINKRSAGATASSGIGTGLGLAGTISSAMANSKGVRSGDEQKEKNLNMAANVLAGGTTVASGAAVIFNATQIRAIKRASEVADECEGALK